MTDRFNPACGCIENINPCNTVFKKVDELPALGDATRNHGYVLPDNTVWVVNSDGTGFTQLNGGNGTPAEAPTVEIDPDTKHWVINGQDTGVLAEGKDGADGQDGQDATAQHYDDTAVKQRLTALENKVDNDTVYDDTNVKNRLTALEAKVDNDTTYTAGEGISISDDNVISATGGNVESIEYTAGEEIEITSNRVINHFPKALHRQYDISLVMDTGKLQETLGFFQYNTGISLDVERLGKNGNHTDSKNMYEVILTGVVKSSEMDNFQEVYVDLSEISEPVLNYEMVNLNSVELLHYIEAVGDNLPVGKRYLIDSPVIDNAKVFLDIIEQDDEGNYLDQPQVRLTFKNTGEDYYLNNTLILLEK